MILENIKLTQYSHGAGCGCKISPATLDQILTSTKINKPDKNLLVGNDTRDDAAVYSLGNGTALISTTDFFMPIVDDPYDFGRIASANAISDVYAMGGKPILAIAILGWPIDKLSAEVAQKVLEGARAICAEAGISLAGGHSIDCPEPVFGLSVNGIIELKHLKRNSTAIAGNKLYLTKALGVGILTTAQKKGILDIKHAFVAPESMALLNKIGESLGKLEYVEAMTDVTGFGLLGHLSEMCEGSNLQAVIKFDKVPKIDIINDYLKQGCIPGGTNRNWESYGHKISTISTIQKNILADPQTSGGLLVAVEESKTEEFETILRNNGIPEKNIVSFGWLEERQNENLIRVI
ncbi:MAG: selenide, water dikinase SelD [Flavobacterium sp.]|nr:selenide, water dikinase SelD [Pedobacter sp.]